MRHEFSLDGLHRALDTGIAWRKEADLRHEEQRGVELIGLVFPDK